MKFRINKKAILIPLSAIFAYLTLSSNSNGTLQSGTFAGCPSCHTASTNTTISSISFVNQGTGLPVTNGQYTPGTAYTVTLTGANATQPAFGFQIRAVNAASSIVGTWSATMTGTTVSNDLLTHSSPRTITSGTATVTGTWTAPAAGTGTVTFGAIINAVNLSNTNAGDMVSSIFTTTLTEAVVAPPTPVITPSGPITACSNQPPTLGISNGAGATSFQWKLNGSNISGATSSTYTPVQSGTYTVVMSNSGGSSPTSAGVLVTINPQPVITATHSDNTLCPGKCDTIALSSTVSGTSYSYTVPGAPGGGTVTGSQLIFCINNPFPPGALTVAFTGTANGCSGTKNETVTVLPQPTAGFNHTHTGLTYTFSNTSTGGTSYEWTIMPGNITSIQQNPVITLPAAGSYTVTLTVTNANGCTTTTTQNLTALSLVHIPGGENFFFGPNPASNVLNIRSGGLKAELNLYDYTGRFVRRLSDGSRSGDYSIRMEDIPAGIYLLQIRANGATALERLIIHR